MNGHEFQRRLTRLGRKNGIEVIFEAGKGKGSHGTICYGAASTTLKDRRKEYRPDCCAQCCASSGLIPLIFEDTHAIQRNYLSGYAERG